MLHVDTDEAFDYEKGQSTKFKKEDYMMMIYQEVLQVHAIREFKLKQL
jgi:hypothetical protein